MLRTFEVVLLLALAGCPDAGTQPTDETDAPEELLLEEGEYTAAAPRFENDTCAGDFDDAGLLPVDLVWTGDATFELRYEERHMVSDVECTVDVDDAVTCGGFLQTLPGATFTLTLVAETSAFRAVSSDSFEIDFLWTLDCEGECGDTPTYPCSTDVFGVFSK